MKASDKITEGNERSDFTWWSVCFLVFILNLACVLVFMMAFFDFGVFVIQRAGFAVTDAAGNAVVVLSLIISFFPIERAYHLDYTNKVKLLGNIKFLLKFWGITMFLAILDYYVLSSHLGNLSALLIITSIT